MPDKQPELRTPQPSPAAQRLIDTNKLLRDILRAGSLVNPLHAKAVREAITQNETVIRAEKPPLSKRQQRRRMRRVTPTWANANLSTKGMP